MPRPLMAQRLAAVTIFTLAGCQFDASVPGVPIIRCDDDAQCPPTMACRASVNRCLPRDPPEKTFPVVEEKLVFPDIGSFGERFSIGFRASEQLLEPPRLHVIASDGRELSAVTRDEAALPEREYRYSYDAPADRSTGVPEGLTRVVVDLVDGVGNTSERLEVGSFTLDFTAPEVIAQAADVTLTPGSGNPLQVVTALTEGSTVRISFVASEPLLDARPSTNVAGLNLTRTGGEVTSFVFTGDLSDAGLVDAEVQLDLAATDRAGNALKAPRLTLRPPLRVDTIAPLAPDTRSPRAVVYTRAPQGEMGGRPAFFEVWGDGGSAEPGVRVMVREPGSDAVLGQTFVADGGGFGPLQLGSADRPRLLITAVDSAGNESARVPVADHTYVASLRGKVLGSTVENPHRLELHGIFGAAVAAQGNEVSALPANASGAGTWKLRTPQVRGPTACTSFGTDLGTARVTALATVSTPSWQWDGEDWKPFVALDAEGDGNPPSDRGLFSYDEGRGRVVMLNNGETWELSASSWKRIPTQPAFSLPTALTYFPPLGRVLSIDSTSGYVFSWSGAVWDWVPTAFSPVRDIATAASDRLGNRVLAMDLEGATWGWDGGWKKLSSDAGVTTTRARMVDDPATGGVWLVDQPAANLLRVRSWLGKDWSDSSETSTTFALGGCALGAFYDPVLQTLVLHEETGQQTLALQRDGGGLVPVHRRELAILSLSPLQQGARGDYSSAHSALACVVPQQGLDYNELLLWDGRQLKLGVRPPFGALSFAGVLDEPQSGSLLVHGGKTIDGGTANRTWRYTDGGWVPGHGGLERAAFAWSRSAGHGGVVLHGGLSGVQRAFIDVAHSDTWLLPFDGGSWVQLPVTGDQAAFHQMMCQDATRTCALGPGSTGNSSVNRLVVATDGGPWIITSAFLGSVTPAAGYGWAGDPALTFGVASGGRRFGNPLSVPAAQGTWTVQPSGYASSIPFLDPEQDGQPQSRTHPVMAFDPRRSVTVLMGGIEPDGGTAPLDQPWELHYSDQRPGAVFTVDLRRGLVRSDATLTGLSMLMRTSTAGVRDGGAASNTELWLARGGAWLPLGTPSDTGVLTVADPALLEAVFRGQPLLRAAAGPSGKNGQAPILFSVDRFDLAVDYRVP